MDLNAFNLYEMSVAREEKIWSECIFIIDSSVLLDFYMIPKATRYDIYKKIFAPNSQRFWIPGHVQYEYLKNRKKVISKPNTEEYEPLRNSTLADIIKAVKEIENKTKLLQEKIKNKDKHPHFDDTEVVAFSEIVTKFQKDALHFNTKVIERIDEAKAEVQGIAANDDVLEALSKFLSVGPDYSFQEILVITNEGKHRYEFKIPPGYEDQKNLEKKGTQIFGDLILWKQILDHSKIVQKPIIFICNDLKEDWCYQQKETEKRIASPREELIKEIYDHSGSEFWMYNFPQFLYHANNYLGTDISDTDIKAIASAIDKPFDFRSDLLRFRCHKCDEESVYLKNELDLDFDGIGSHERSMGPENHYRATEYLECQHCHSPVEVEFNIWEYPVGIRNYDEVEITGANLVEVFSYDLDFSDEPQSDICEKCGNEFKDERHIGICDDCDYEYAFGKK